MKAYTKRALSLLIALTMLISVFAGISLVSAAGSTINSGTRHELCTSLSAQAEAYYTGTNTWEKLSELSGINTTSSVDAMGSQLFNALQKLMKGTLTTTVSYNSLTSYWKETDRQKGGSDAVLFYSDVQGSGYNREHVWPKSHGNFYQSGAGSDLHHLRPTDSVINNIRNHWTFGDVKAHGISHSTKDYNGKTVLWYNTSYSQNDCLGLVEVNDNIKGDIARILLYVYVTYGVSKENSNLFTKTASSGSGNSANTGDKVIESLDTLLEWMEMDPVDTWEMSRNDCVENIQHNRNVFIDYPEFAWLLFGRDVPAGYATPSGNGGSATTYTITPVANGNGTVSLSGNVITATPANGYYVASYEVTKGTATVTQNGNNFSIRPSSDCTVQINFAAKTAVTLSFSVPEGVTQKAINCYAGDSITLPTPSGAPTAAEHEYQFIGWATQPEDNITEKPDFYAVGASYTPSASTTFYALYRYYIAGEGSADGYAKITSEAELTDGASYVFVSTVSGKAMSTDVGSNWVNLGGTYGGDTIEVPAASDVWTLVDGVLTCEGGNLYSAAAKTIALDSEEGTQWTFTLSGSQWQLSYGNNILCCNGTSGWRPYSGGYGSDRSFYIFKEGSAGTTYYTTDLGEPCEHSYTNAVTAPTCTAQGYTTHTCTKCGYSYTDTYTKALGHAWDAGKITLPATETNDGVKTYTCTRCGTTKTESIPSLGGCDHHHTYPEHKDATCAEDGYDRVVCDDCGEIVSETVIKALGHNFVDGICTRCGAEDPDYKPDPIPCDGGKDCPSYHFIDVNAGNWYHEAVDFAVTEKLFNGMTETTFEPNTAMTRAMLVTVLYRAEGSPSVSGVRNPFSDVFKGQWFHDAVIWAAKEGIVNGTTEITFSPNASITREQIAAILYRYAGSPEVSGNLYQFTDALSVSEYAVDAMTWAVNEEIIGGISGKLCPKDNATRAQIATILFRYLAK